MKIFFNGNYNIKRIADELKIKLINSLCSEGVIFSVLFKDK